MGLTDFIVAVGTDQQQVLHVRLGQKILEHIECRGIEPLHVIKKEREGMFRSREYADELPKKELKTSLGFQWRQLGHWRLLANDKPQLWYEIDEKQSVRTQRLTKCVSRFTQVLL